MCKTLREKDMSMPTVMRVVRLEGSLAMYSLIVNFSQAKLGPSAWISTCTNNELSCVIYDIMVSSGNNGIR